MYTLTRLLCLLVLTAPWVYGQSLRDWKYRTEFTVDNSRSPEPLTDYSLSFTWSAAELVAAGKLNASGRDIRLTDSDGRTLLCHWIERDLSQPEAKIWVKIPFLEAGSRKTIYLYYGNPAAEPAQNSHCAFQVFDDFSEPTVNTEQWEQLGGGSLEIRQGKALFKARGTDLVLRAHTPLQMPVIIEMQVTRSSGKFVALALTHNSPVFWNGYALALDHLRDRMDLALAEPDVTPCGGFSMLPSLKAVSAGETNGLWALSWLTSNTLMGNWPGGALLEQNSFREQKQRRMALGVLACQFGGDYAGELEVDWVRVRKFASQEPAVTTGHESLNTNSEAIIPPREGYTG